MTMIKNQENQANQVRQRQLAGFLIMVQTKEKPSHSRLGVLNRSAINKRIEF